MAKQHTPETPANPDVAYERVDIESGEVLLWGLGFAFLGLAGTLFSLWLAVRLLQAPAPIVQDVLPPAAVEETAESKLPPEPRLEALEDLRLEKPRLFPPRATEYLAPQQRELDGIEKAFQKMQFPSRKQPEPPAKTPNKASAGRWMEGN